MPEATPRYCAFISYAREDEAVARWLQRRIETYRLPRRLRRTGIAARLGRVFRDRVEFSADADLELALRRALGESDHLIVVCSPAAVASPWVRREVEMFAELHGHARILAALVSGEPRDAFPAPLTGADGAQPLAADLRPGGDGRRLGALKLIAAIARVRLDELLRRDAQRRARWLAWVTAGALTLAAAMTALAVVAVRARAAAETQREKAEGLVDFMLTDLRKRLVGVGKLELLTDVNRHAIGYYRGEDLARLPPKSLERRAALLLAMGEDDEKRGRLAQARTQWAEAHRTTAALLAAAPNDPARVFAHSQSEYWVGFGAWRAGDLAGAREGWLTYARLTDRLRTLTPDNLVYTLEQGNAFSNLGTLTLRAFGQPKTAEAQFQKSLSAFEEAGRAQPRDPDIRAQVADALGWIGDCERLLGHFSEAKANRQRQHAILAALSAADPTNLELRTALVGNAMATARIDVAAGRLTAAIAKLTAAEAEAGAVARADPANIENRDRRRLIGLLEVSAWLKIPPSRRPADLLDRTAICAAHQTQLGNEVIAWCRILRSKLAPDEALRLQTLLQLDSEVMRGRFSRSWGLDLATGAN